KTTPGLVFGTLPYMSPEQARGQTVDERTDLWSLGVVLFEMIAKRIPFTGETPSDIVAAILERDTPLISDFVPDTPKQLRKILDRALAKDLKSRYWNARDLHVDLKHLREELAFDARRRLGGRSRVINAIRRNFAL